MTAVTNNSTANTTAYGTISQVNDHLFICAGRAITLPGLKERRIKLVINATLELPNDFPRDVEYMDVKIDDSPGANISKYFDPVADKIYDVRKAGGRTLVHCIAGASRSASLCLAYLMKYEKMRLREAFTLLKSKRGVVHPNSGFFQQLVDYENKLFGKTSVQMVELASMGPDFLIPDLYVEDYKGFVWLAKIQHALKKA